MRRAVVLGVVAVADPGPAAWDSTSPRTKRGSRRTSSETCTDQGGDDLQDVCQCAYDSFEQNIPFDRFQRVDESASATTRTPSCPTTSSTSTPTA